MPSPLPKPSAAEYAHTHALQKHIMETIHQSGPMRFLDFMDLALYHPTLGYYRSQTPFGKQGDFITAAHCGPWFAKALATYCTPILQQHPNFSLCEFGAGNGHMACDLLLALEEKNTLPNTYIIVETSPHLQMAQKEALAAYPHLLNLVQWPTTLPEHFSGIMFANEVLDAMPFHCYRKTAAAYEQLFVTIDNNTLTSLWQTVQDPIPESICNTDLEEGHVFEVNPHIKSWLAHLHQHMKEGLCFLIDYGAVADEYFARSPQGYCRAFYRHHVHGDVLLYPGIQDITTHVNFSTLADAALATGWKIDGFTPQSNFLLDGGIAEISLPDYDTPEGLLARTEIKTLMLPQEMGELFKVMVLSKNNNDFKGFSYDQRHRL